MPVKAFLVDEELVFVIYEKDVNFSKLKERGFDLLKTVLKQKCVNNLTMMNGIIYPNLVKEFRVYASIGRNGMGICSFVYGFPITTTPTSITAAIGCNEKWSTVEH